MLMEGVLRHGEVAPLLSKCCWLVNNLMVMVVVVTLKVISGALRL